jgi:hypothetical protein
VGDEDVATRLVVTSGKMVLLDKLLRRLQDTGHRCGHWGGAEAAAAQKRAARPAGEPTGILWAGHTAFDCWKTWEMLVSIMLWFLNQPH